MSDTRPLWTAPPDCPSCHAATIVEIAAGHLLAAWFAGSHEGHADVAIWLAHFAQGRWSPPSKIADAPGVPLWNPVLFQDREGRLWLFYKIGPTVPTWSGVVTQSRDQGQTWSPPTLLPAGLLGPAKNKPITLSNGDILCGSSVETWRNWSAWVEISEDGGLSWTKHGPIIAPGHGISSGTNLVSATWDVASGQLLVPQDYCGVIQPTVWEYAPGRLKMLLRATQRVGFVCIATSDDYGRTWTVAHPTTLPHSNSGLDAVRLADGRIVLACNPAHTGRTPLSLLVSSDNGETWPVRLDLETEPGEYSYPAIIQTMDTRVHVVYTHCRTRIQHTIIDLADLA